MQGHEVALPVGFALIQPSGIDIGVYANAFPPQSKKATANAVILDIRADLDPLSYTGWAQRWVDQGATMVGGCCGISPEHIAELSRTFS
jgi:homocysteine S-methyltransferase